MRVVKEKVFFFLLCVASSLSSDSSVICVLAAYVADSTTIYTLTNASLIDARRISPFSSILSQSSRSALHLDSFRSNLPTIFTMSNPQSTAEKSVQTHESPNTSLLNSQPENAATEVANTLVSMAAGQQRATSIPNVKHVVKASRVLCFPLENFSSSIECDHRSKHFDIIARSFSR